MSPTLPWYLRRLIEYPHLMPALFIVLAVLLCHVLNFPLTSDEFFHQLTFRQHPMLNVSNPFTDLFSFATGEPSRIRTLIERSGLVWFTDPHIKSNFLRPLSAVTHWIDFTLWPDSSTLPRIHSFLWYGLNIALAFVLFNTLFKDKRIALIGVLFFALSIHHYLPIAWIAARNALLTCGMSMITLLLYFKACDDNWNLGFVLAPIALLIALLCGEASLSITPFLFACVLFIDKRPKPRALLSLLPCVLVSLLWLYAYQALGYGAEYSGYYISPQDNPLIYGQRLLVSMPLLLFGAIFNLPPDPSSAALGTKSASFLITYLISFGAFILFLYFIYALVLPFIKKDRMIGFWLIALIVSLLPGASVSASSRTLIIPGLASIGLLLSIIHNVFFQNESIKPHALRLLKGIMLLRVCVFFISSIAISAFSMTIDHDHVLYSPTFNGFNITDNTSIFAITQTSNQTLIASSRYVVEKYVQMKNAYTLFYPSHDFEITRTPSNELIAASSESLISGFNASSFHNLYRDFKHKPFFIGETFTTADMDISILELNALGAPVKIQFSFKPALDDNNHLWLITDTKTNRFIPFELPATGETKHYTMSK
ncbi:MAG: hypothetical protein AAGF06_01410 [Pseudomonadota bacterium]